jgi:hypothetical protein
MRRPPVNNPRQILFSRTAYDWINRINQKHKQFSELHLSPEQGARVKQWVEAEFSRSALAVEGALPDADRVAAEAVRSLRVVEALVEERGPAAQLSTELLFRLRGEPGAEQATRVSARVESAIQWFSVESFVELNPVEQASIVFLRLLEIRPFERLNESRSLIAASLFTLRIGLPPLIIKPGDVDEYRAALEEGLRMDTRPMVELAARSVETTLAGMIEISNP